MKTKSLILVACFISIACFSQQNNWHLLSKEKDTVYGIDMQKAYSRVLKNKKPETIIVAVIDTGIDTSQVDLKAILWKNKSEKGHDEDGNGYKGDVHGWNFLGNPNGKNIIKESRLEYQRLYFHLKEKYSNMNISNLSKKKKIEYSIWLKINEKVNTDSISRVSRLKTHINSMIAADSLIQKEIGKTLYYFRDIKELVPVQKELKSALNALKPHLGRNEIQTNQQYLEEMKQYYNQAMYKPLYNPLPKRKEIINDNYTDFNDRFYGNNDLTCQYTCDHGTHVAGIIGAIRDNGIGMDGISNAVQLMAVRVVPDGDEYDKDVALAIRYAVDNGAKVINMSFAKPYSPERKWVEDAIKYAAKKDVLLVNAAGNEFTNIDSIPCYPTAKYIRGKKKAPNMITVGASGPTKENLVAGFSNYGQAVDVFAPGLEIYSTLPNNLYAKLSGTSMASPVVAGLACVLRSYYPKLSAKQVKYIIEQSVMKIDFPVTNPGTQEQVHMKTLCRTGGIVNAYNAVLLAEEMNKK